MVPSGLTASSGATIPQVLSSSSYKIDVDDVALPGVRSFYIIVTEQGTSSQTFGPYSLTMSCTMGSGVSASSNVILTEPVAISTVPT